MHIPSVSRQTERFVALEHDFAVTSDVGAIVDYLDATFAPLVVPGAPTHRYGVTATGDQYQLEFDGEVLVRSSEPSRPIAHLMWHVNRSAAETDHFAVLHASAAALGNRAVLLPGDSMAGKTTMVAGLLSAGLRYLSDELAPVDRATLRVHAYPKPLSIDPGSWAMLPTLEPRIDDVVRPYVPNQWWVSPTVFGEDAVAPSAAPALIVFPRYVAGAPLAVTRISTADAIATASRYAINLRREPAVFTTIARVVERCACYTLIASVLGEAVEAITDILRDTTDRHDRIA